MCGNRAAQFFQRRLAPPVPVFSIHVTIMTTELGSGLKNLPENESHTNHAVRMEQQWRSGKGSEDHHSFLPSFSHILRTLSTFSFRVSGPGARGMAAAQFVSISKSSLKESQRYVKGALSSHDFAPLSLISRKQNERKNPKRKIEREKKRRRRAP